MTKEKHEFNPEEEIITLIDEDDEPHSFQILEVFDFQGKRYAALERLDDEELEMEDEEEYEDEEEEADFEEADFDIEGDHVSEIWLLRYDENDKGEEILSAIEDEEEFNRVREEFERLLEEDV